MTEQTKPKIEPWDLAAKEGKTIIIRIVGPMIGVYYPFRRTGDLYVAMKDHPVHCCQCDEDFPVKDFMKHVNSHNKQFKKYPDVIIDHGLVEPKAEGGK